LLAQEGVTFFVLMDKESKVRKKHYKYG